MSTAAASSQPARVPTDPIWRLSVDQYHAMIDVGILTEDHPVELLEGWLVTKMPKNPSHRLATGLIREALEGLLPDDWYVDSQEPITTLDSEPEPDVMVIKGPRRHYSDRHPGPRDVPLVVEVSDATLERDQTLKKRLYAQAGIAVYWIVNLRDLRIEAHMEPSGATDPPEYRWRRDYDRGEVVPVVIEGAEIGRLDLQELLP